jgi:hypothetical protein
MPKGLTIGRDSVTEAIRRTLSTAVVELVELRLVLPFPENVIDIAVVKVLGDSES